MKEVIDFHEFRELELKKDGERISGLGRGCVKETDPIPLSTILGEDIIWARYAAYVAAARFEVSVYAPGIAMVKCLSCGGDSVLVYPVNDLYECGCGAEITGPRIKAMMI